MKSNNVFIKGLRVFSHVLFCVLFLYVFGRNSFLRPGAFGSLYKEYAVGLTLLATLYLEYFLLVPRLFMCRRYGIFLLLSLFLVLFNGIGEMFWVWGNVQKCVRLHCDDQQMHVLFRVYTLLVILRDAGFYCFFFVIRVLRDELEIKRKKAIILGSQTQFIDVRRKNEILFLHANHIVYCEQIQNITYFYSVSGERYYRFCSMRELEELLDSSRFVRISRQHIVQIQYIESYNDQFVTLQAAVVQQKTSLPISAAWKESVLAILYRETNIRPEGFFASEDAEYIEENDMETDFPEDSESGNALVIRKRELKLQKIYNYVREHPNCKINNILEDLDLSKSTAERYLRLLRKHNLIQYSGTWKVGGYTVVDPDLILENSHQLFQ